MESILLNNPTLELFLFGITSINQKQYYQGLFFAKIGSQPWNPLCNPLWKETLELFLFGITSRVVFIQSHLRFDSRMESITKPEMSRISRNQLDTQILIYVVLDW